MTNHENLTEKTITGVWWVGAARTSKIISQLLVTTLLAHLIDPEAFGIIGMAVVFTGFLALFNDFGFGQALIQRKQIDHLLVESSLWANLAIGVLLAMLTIMFAPLVGLYYRNSTVPLVLYALSLNFPVASLSIVQAAIFERQLTFRPVVVAEVLASAVAAVCAIIAALMGAGVWSLVLWQLLQSLVKTLTIWIFSDFRPLFQFSAQRLKEVIGFSSNLFGFNIVNYFARNADYLLVGRILGAGALGLYTMAYNIMLFPLSSLTNVLARVLFPALSRRQSDLSAFRRGYLRAIRAIAFISFPLMTGMFIVAHDFVSVVLGENWNPIVPIIRIFVWVGMAQSLLSLNGSVYVALGYVRLRFWLGTVFSIVSVGGIVIGISYGTIFTTALGYAVAVFILILPATIVPLRLMKQPVTRFFAIIAPIGVASVIMAIGIILTRTWLISSLELAQKWVFLIEVAMGGLLYMGATFLINHSILIELKRLILHGQPEIKSV